MKQFLIDIIRDDSNISMVRFLALICVFAAIGIAIVGINKGMDLNALSVLCGVFLGSGLVSKVAQKAIENKKDS